MSGKGLLKLAVWAAIAAVLAAAAVDCADAWRTKRILRAAAWEGAKITVTTPLDAATCTDPTPCSIESAAEAVKQDLTKAGLTQAGCLAPRKPSFSGILVWVFSCDGSTGCDPGSGRLCVKIDRTAVVVARDGKWIPSTRVTVQCPQRWPIGAALLPKSLATSAVLPD